MEHHRIDISAETLRWLDTSAKLSANKTSAATVAHFETKVTATNQDKGMGSDKAVVVTFVSKWATQYR